MVKLKAEDLLRLIQAEAEFEYVRPYVTAESFDAVVASPHSRTFLLGGEPICCIGIREYWPGRGEAWAMFSQSAGPHMLQIHREALRYFQDCPIRRIEAAVEVGFEKGHRWVKALGFELEARLLRKFLPNGEDAVLYAKVRG